MKLRVGTTLATLICSGLLPFTVTAAPATDDVKDRIRALMEAEERLEAVPFAAVIEAVTGKQILPLNATNAVDSAILSGLGAAMDRALQRLNDPASTAQGESRINEVSRHFEDAIREELNRTTDFTCEVPRTVAGATQRSGYPDLRAVHRPSGRVLYLDPKLFDASSRTSSLRTFYFEPRRETSKVLEDAHHVLIGFAHTGKQSGSWRFVSWDLVDLSRLKVRLKAEFQAANRELYTPEAVLKSGGQPR